MLPQELGESREPCLLTSSRLRRHTGSALYQPQQLCQRNQLLQPAALIKSPPSPDFCCRYRGKRYHSVFINQVTFKSSNLPHLPLGTTAAI